MEALLAFVGALVGAAVARFADFVFRRRERRETQQEEARRRLHAEMREMLLDRVRELNYLEGELFLLQLSILEHEKLGVPWSEATKEFSKGRLKRIQDQRHKHGWEVYRIDDVQLRLRADEFKQLANELVIKLTADVSLEDSQRVVQEMLPSINRLKELEEQIVTRLDELGW